MMRAPRRVMIVDDDPDARAILRLLVEHEAPGCQVTEAVDGEAALCLLRSGEQPEVVITDLMMPGTANGIDVADAAKAKGILTVVVTSYLSLAPERHRCISKPRLFASNERVLPTIETQPPRSMPLPIFFLMCALGAGIVVLLAGDERRGEAMANPLHVSSPLHTSD